MALLNDKIKFSRFARQHGLKTPDTIPVSSPDQLRSLNARCGHDCERLPILLSLMCPHVSSSAQCPPCFLSSSAAKQVFCLCGCRPAAFKGRRYLLKSVHYASLSRADLFTLPCDPEVHCVVSRYSRI